MTRKKFTLTWANHQQRWFAKWHVYLGIIAGLIVSIVGATGSVLVFRDEIDRALNPELFTVPVESDKIPLEEMIPLIRERYPDLDFSYVSLTTDALSSTYFTFDNTAKQTVYFNPYTADICGKRLTGSSFTDWMVRIHRTLLIPVVGRYVVGIASLILLILTITGLRLWIPKKWGQLKSMLTVNFKASLKRQNYDWHNVLGFYTSPVVGVLSLTGFCITFSVVVVPLLFILNGQAPQGVAKLLNTRSQYVPGVQPLIAQEIAAIGEKHLPDATLQAVRLPADSTGAYQLSYQAAYVAETGKQILLIIDQYSGEIVLNSATDFPNVGHAYMSWLTPLHYGSFGGIATKLLAFIGGMVPLALFITGFVIWWPRYKRQGTKNSKQAATRSIKQLTTTHSPLGTYVIRNFRKGIGYALWSLLVMLVMGALYGAISGIVIQPAMFFVIFAAVLIVANFVISCLTISIGFIISLFFRKIHRPILKYFVFSFAFAAVFIPIILLINFSGINFF